MLKIPKELSKTETNLLKPILELEVTRAIEQLKELRENMVQPSFVLKAPNTYTLYQRLVLSSVLAAVQDSYAAMEKQDGNV